MRFQSAFLSWLIANFEQALFWICTIVGVLFLFLFASDSLIIHLQNLNFTLGFGIGVFIVAIPTKSGIFNTIKYFVVVGSIFLILLGQEKVFWFWVVFSFASAISGYMAYYAYVNIDDVLSRRMLYRNSSASLFEYTWKYVWDRFSNISVSIITCVTWLIYLLGASFLENYKPI